MESVRRCAYLFVVFMLAAGMAYAQSSVSGVTADGALYKFDFPQNWNGDLVLYAHGIVDPGQEVALPDVGWLSQAFQARGYAVGYSSWAQNGYAVRNGVQRTHQLKGLFTEIFKAPKRTILVGHSLGGLVVLQLAEQYPAQYAGALPLCGVLGGSVPEVQYLANVRVLYDLFFSSGIFETPGMGGYKFSHLPGDAGHPQPMPDAEWVPMVSGNLTAGFASPLVPSLNFLYAANVLPNSSDPAEKATGAVYAIGFHVRYGADLINRTHGRIPFDNMTTTYVDPMAFLFKPAFDYDAFINGYVTRYASPPDAVNYISHEYTPTGKLRIPVYTLHSNRDPMVPAEIHETLYGQVVHAAGADKWLAQKTVNAFGHCTFGPTAQTSVMEQLNAFDALVTWIDTGKKPTP